LRLDPTTFYENSTLDGDLVLIVDLSGVGNIIIPEIRLPNFLEIGLRMFSKSRKQQVWKGSAAVPGGDFQQLLSAIDKMPKL